MAHREKGLRKVSRDQNGNVYREVVMDNGKTTKKHIINRFTSSQTLPHEMKEITITLTHLCPLYLCRRWTTLGKTDYRTTGHCFLTQYMPFISACIPDASSDMLASLLILAQRLFNQAVGLISEAFFELFDSKAHHVSILGGPWRPIFLWSSQNIYLYVKFLSSNWCMSGYIRLFWMWFKIE